jgi:23S rRNA (uracil1939-C5)-methyltransferase
VGDAVRRIGGRLVPDPPITVSPTLWRYRTKVTLAVAGACIGLRRRDQPAEVFDLADCLIVRQPIMALWAILSKSRARLPDGLKSLILREDRDAGLHVIAVGGETCWDAGPLAQDIGDTSISYWWQPGGGAARVVVGRRTGFPVTAFEQVNRQLAHAIRVAAVEALGDVRGRVVWDLYGGVGDTAELLADRGACAWTVDSHRSAVEWGRQHGTARVTRIDGLVEEEMARLPEPSAVVLNPPRTGVGSQVTEWLNRWAVGSGERVAYVSCDPATLARDIARMPRLAVTALTAYDLFPQTAHVETLAVLEGV